MTIQQLIYIVTLDKERHFARAAEACNVSQPGLTIQLKNLEEEIGIKIFDRSKVPLKPTILGSEIIVRAKKILREVEGIRDFVVNEKNTLEGNIRLGVISTLSPYLVPQFIGAMKKVAPKMKFTIREASTVQLMKDLDTGALDVALMATPTGNPHFREFPVFNEPFVAFLHASHPLAGQEFYEMREDDKTDLLLLEDEYCYNAQLLDICDLNSDGGFEEQFSYDINSIETLKNMVRAHLGFAIIPQLSVVNELENGLFKQFKEPKPIREISLVVSDTFSRKLLLGKISEAIWSILPEALKKDFSYRKIKWNDSPYFIDAAK